MSIWRRQQNSSSVATHDGVEHPINVAEALVAVREAIQSHDGDGSGRDHLRVLIRLLCVFARQDKMPPERLLVELKNTLATVPERDALAVQKREDMRNRVIELTIESYFSDGC